MRNLGTRYTAFAYRKYIGAPLAGIVAFAFIALVSHLRRSASDNYIFLAKAFLQGHPWIYDGTHDTGNLPTILTYAGSTIDALLHQGKYYIIEGPVPALLLMPIIALGIPPNQTALAATLAGVAVAAAWEIARRLSLAPLARLFLCGFLLLGSDLFWCATLGDVWFLAHASAAAFTLLALLETQGQRRGWVTAFCAACAAGSRFSLIAALPVYAFLLTRDTDASTRKRRLIGFGAMLLPCAILWIWYNEARWHLPYDIGYLLFYHADAAAGSPIGSPLQIAFLKEQLYSFFIRPPELTGAYPYIVPSLDGTALTWTSPALLLAFFARKPKYQVLALWTATTLTALPNFFYYVNGRSQFGMRHALDFEPFLFVLIALTVREYAPRLNAALYAYCAVSMLIGGWGVWYWLTFYRPL